MTKLFIKDFRKKYGPWWGRFSSTIAATVCGITITFGLTYWKTLNEKKKLLRTCEVWAMDTIKDQFDNLDMEYENAKQQMAVIDSVKKYNQKKMLAQCPDSILSQFTDIFMQEQFSSDDDMAEMPFRNMELLRNADDIRVIRDIYILYKLADALDVLNETWKTRLYEIRKRHVPTTYMSADSNFDLNLTTAILNDKDAVFFLFESMPTSYGLFEKLLNVGKKKYKQEVKILNITEEEFDVFNSSLFEEYDL